MKTKAQGIQLNDVMDGSEVWDLKIIPINHDGKIVSGLVVGHTLFQNQATMLAMYPGELKTEPSLGVGLKSELLNENLLEARHRIREVFPKDGLTVRKLDLYDVNNIKIEADYE